MKTAKMLLVLLVLGMGTYVGAQCTNNNTFLMNATPPASPGVSTMTVNCMNGGQYVTTGVIAGNVYTFSTCGNTAFDTQITVLNTLTSALIGYNDDACGVQSTVTWTATFTGNVNVLIDQFPCLNSGLCTTLTITSTPPVQNGNGCNTNTTICTPGVAGPFGFSTPGPPVSSCLDFFGPNYAYIVLYITQSGPLQMLINGSAATGFLDVSVFNVPPGVDPCVASLSTANEISCNYASASSGCNQIGTNFPCASSVPSPMVTAGQVLFIVVENWSGTSNNFTLQLGPPPAAQTGPPNGTVNPAGPFCSSAAATQLTAVNSGGTWSGPGVSTTGMFNPATAGVGTHTINYAIGSAPCVGSGSTSITVSPMPSVNAVPNQTLCSNAATTAINFTGTSGATYNWTNNNTVIGLGASGSGNIPSFTATNATGSPVTSTITVTPVIGGCTGTPITFTITINPSPTVNTVTSQTRCANTLTAAVNFSGSVSTATYNWTNSNTAIGLGASGSGNIGAFTATNATGTPITGTITVTPTANGCTGTPITFTYTVNPTPTVNPVTSQTLCAGISTSAINFSGNVATTTYNWTNSNTAIGLLASGAGNIGAFTTTNATGSPITGTVTVTPTVNGCTGTPINFTITVNPIPTVNAVTSQTRCAGAATAAVNFSGNVGSAVYNWTNSNTSIGLGASGSGNIGAFTTTNATGAPISGTISITPSANGCVGTPTTFTITVNPVPTVNSVTSQSLCAGAITAPINFAGNVGTTAYNWTNSNSAIGLGASGSGNIGAFTTTNTTGSAITGTITVTPTANGCSGTPINFTITVNPVGTPTFTATSYCFGTASPAATITGTVGGTFSFNPAPGGGVTINPTTGSITGGVSGSTYTVQYTTSGACPQTSTQTVSVYASPTVTAANVSVCTGGSVIITANGASTYTWNNGLGAGQSHTVSPASTTSYNVTGTSINGCTNTATMTVTVTANAPINAGPDVTICNGTPTTLTATGGVSYNWIAPINAAGASQTVSPSSTTTYTVNGTDAAGCTGTDQIVVTVNAIPTVNAVTSQTLCANTATTAISFSGSMVTSTYNWTNTNPAIGLGATGSGNIASFTATNATSSPITATITATPIANGCTGTATTFTITVNPIPTVSVVANQTNCANTATTLVNFSGSMGTATYNWTNTNSAIGLGASGSGNIASFSATNGSGAPISGTITVTPTANGCVGTSTNFTITVNPIPTVNAVTSQTLCANTATNAISFSGNSATSTYNWTNSSTAIGLGASGSGNIPSFTATNATGSAVSGTIAVTPTAYGCVGTPTNFSISVNPIPSVNSLSNEIVCAGGSTSTVSFSGSAGSAIYNWTNSNPSIGLAGAGVGNIGSFTAINATGSPITGTVTITPTANGCSGVPTNYTITVNPLPTGTMSGSATVCQNDASPVVTFTGMNGTAPYTFTYTLNGGANQTIVSNAAGVATINVPTGVAGTFDYDLVSVQDASSTACSQTQTGTATIVVNLLPTATIMGTTSVCLGGANPTVTLTGSNGTAPYTFTYNLNGGANQTITSVGNTATISVPTIIAGVFNFNLVSIQDGSASGCTQTQVGVAIVTVNALPNVFAGNDFTICEGQQATLTGSGATSYVWDQGVVNAVVFSPGATNLYTVTGTDENGCVNADEVTIVVEPLPLPSFIGDNLSGCAPLTVTFTNTTPGAMSNCLWTLESGTVLTGCGNVTSSFNAEGTYDVTLATTSPNGCTASVTYTDYITVGGNPMASFTPSSTSINNFNPEVYFDNTSTGSVTYDWNFGDGSSTINTTSPIYSFPDDTPGTYTVQLIAYSAYGCPDTAYATIELTEEVIFYVPNSFTPDDDDYNPTFRPVFTSGYDPYDYTLLLFNRWGEIIFESHNAEIGWDGTYGGKLMQDGIYTWKIEFKTNANDERKLVTGHVNMIR